MSPKRDKTMQVTVGDITRDRSEDMVVRLIPISSYAGIPHRIADAAGISVKEATEIVAQGLRSRADEELGGHCSAAYHDGWFPDESRAREILPDKDNDFFNELQSELADDFRGCESMNPFPVGPAQVAEGEAREHWDEWFEAEAKERNNAENGWLDRAMEGLGIPSLAGTHKVVHTTAEEQQNHALEW